MPRKTNPRRGMYEMVILRQASPPIPGSPNYVSPGLIPGYGQAQRARKHQQLLNSHPVFPDGPESVARRGPFAKRRKSRKVKPNPSWLSNARNQRN